MDEVANIPPAVIFIDVQNEPVFMQSSFWIQERKDTRCERFYGLNDPLNAEVVNRQSHLETNVGCSIGFPHSRKRAAQITHFVASRTVCGVLARNFSGCSGVHLFRTSVAAHAKVCLDNDWAHNAKLA
jgi:hypothetical protein